MSYVVKPTQGELASARASVEGVLEACTQQLPTDQSVSVALGWSDDPVVVDVLGGADGVCWGAERVEIRFSSQGSVWTDAVSGMAARMYGRAWVRDRFPDSKRSFWWQDIAEGAAGEVLAARVAPAYTPPWVEGFESAMGDVWPVVEPRLGESVESPLVDDRVSEVVKTDDLDSDGSITQFLPEALAAVAGPVLSESYDLESFPELHQSDVVAALEDTVGE